MINKNIVFLGFLLLVPVSLNAAQKGSITWGQFVNGAITFGDYVNTAALIGTTGKTAYDVMKDKISIKNPIKTVTAISHELIKHEKSTINLIALPTIAYFLYQRFNNKIGVINVKKELIYGYDQAYHGIAGIVTLRLANMARKQAGSCSILPKIALYTTAGILYGATTRNFVKVLPHDWQSKIYSTILLTDTKKSININ